MFLHVSTKDTGLGKQDRDSCTKVSSSCHSKNRLVFTKMSAFWILHVASGSLASTMLLAAALRRHAGTLAPFFTATALSP